MFVSKEILIESYCSVIYEEEAGVGKESGNPAICKGFIAGVIEEVIETERVCCSLKDAFNWMVEEFGIYSFLAEDIVWLLFSKNMSQWRIVSESERNYEFLI